MRGGVERVMSAPLASSTPIKPDKPFNNGKEAAENNNTASVSTIETPGKDPDDVNETHSNGLISLDVTLPDGQHCKISVDYSTPMLDLLVSLAARSRLSPTGLSLVLVSEDSGKPLSYTPNQTIGSLQDRVVHVVSKNVSSGKSDNKASKKEKPFEVTQRFTVNLPTGQKTVLRVSPLTPLGDAVISACKEKGLELDLDRYVLQLPKKPGIPIDPRATILQTGVQEISLVSRENADRSYAMSMPDLSKMPPSVNDPHSFGQLNGQPKKKRGFLSFLQKKDKKFKTEVRRSLVLKSTSNLDVSTPPATRATTLPEPASPELDQNHQNSRPKSMFVSSSTLPLNEKPYEQLKQTIVAPPRKKRRAPEPPVSNSHIFAQQEKLSSKESVETNKDIKENVSTLQEITESFGQEETSCATVLSHPGPHEEIQLANGQHDLNLTTRESPETKDAYHVKAHTNLNGNFSTNTKSINEDNKKLIASENGFIKDKFYENAELRIDTSVSQDRRSSLSPSGSDSPSHKKNKAPVPPSPVLTTSSPKLDVSSTLSPPPPAAATSSIDAAETLALEEESVHLVQSHSDIPSRITHQLEMESPALGNQKQIPTSRNSGIKEQLADAVLETDIADMSWQNILAVSELKKESAVMDFNDILNGVVFEEEPWSPQVAFAKRAGVEAADKDDAMMMMETASVTSEDIGEIDSSSHTSRPCAFIPPPPPSEPPPPEQHAVDFEALSSTTAPIFVDKGTAVSEDNASLATSSTKSSPGQASYGGLNEMVVLVEQVNSISLENPVDQEDIFRTNGTDTNIISNPLVSSDSASEVSHPPAANWDTDSDLSTGQEKKNLSSSVVAQIIAESADTDICKGEIGFESEEIMNILPTLPPPPQFEDRFDFMHEDKPIIKETEDNVCKMKGTEAEVEEINTEIEERKTEMEGIKAANDRKIETVDIKTGNEENKDQKVEKEDQSKEKENDSAEKHDYKVEKDDKIKKEDTKGEEEEEEYFTEIIEELIIPLGPNGYNFAAARKKTEVELKEPPKETFSSESGLTGRKPPIVNSIYQLLAKTGPTSKITPLSKKEEFVITTEDLSKVSLLPPRSNKEKPSMEYQPSVETQPFMKNQPSMTNQPSVYISQKYPIMHNFGDSIDRNTTTGKYNYENVQPTFVRSGITSQSKPPQQISESKEKSTISSKPPSVTSSIHSDNVPVSSEDESLFSIDPLLTKSRPHLLMNSHSNPVRRSADRTRGADNSKKDVNNEESFHAGADSDAVADSGEQTSSVTSGYNVDTGDQKEVLQRQYLALKSQIQQWQDQLAWNQNLLASQAVGSEHQTEQYQQLSEQMSVQQQMALQQLQSTMLALQQQQHIPASGQENGDPSTELAARIHQPVAGAAEPTHFAAASPPPILPSPQKQPSDLRSGVSSVKKRPTVERELEPREQLMIAIRTFSKRGLKSVPIEMTRWTPSAL